MRRIVLMIALIFGALIFSVNAQPLSDSPMSQAWVLGSKLSAAAVLHAQAKDNTAFVDKQFALASAAAKTFGLKLPPLPAKKGNKIDDSAAALFYLLNTTGKPIGSILTDRYGAEHAAIFEVALKANTLFILYGSDDPTTNTIAGVIRSRSAKTSYLPTLMASLLGQIDQRASYDRIAKELIELDDLAPKFIAIKEFTRRGQEKYSAKDYAGSAAEYAKGLAVNPSDIECYTGRGRANMQMGKHADAIADYAKAIQVGKRDGQTPTSLALSFHNRAVSYFVSGQNAPAISDLNEAIKLRPDYALAFKVRGLVHQKMGNAKLAALDLQKAEQLQPGITR